MPRVNKQVARKDYPEIGVIKGEPYYKWSMKIPSGGGWTGVVRKSKTYPKRSQLTSSDFLGQAYDLEDSILASAEPDELEGYVDDIRALGEEQSEKLSNMPEGLQEGSTGQLLQERAEGCEEWADAVESAVSAWREGIDEAGDEEDWPEADEFLGDCGCPF